MRGIYTIVIYNTSKHFFYLFICLFLFIFIFSIDFYWFSLISSISAISRYFLYFHYFSRGLPEKDCPPTSKTILVQKCQPDEETWELKNCFFFRPSRQIRLIHPSDRKLDDFVTRKIRFPNFLIFAFFGSLGHGISMDSEARPKDFKAFWSPAKGF